MGLEPLTIAQTFAPPAGPRVVETAILPPAATNDADPAASTLLRDRLSSLHRRGNASRSPTRPPIPGSRLLRFAVSFLLGTLAMFTLGGGLLILLLWQEGRASGVVSSQIDRAWELFETLRNAERIVVFATVPLATAWVALTTLNVRRATARRCNPVLAALSIPAGVVGVWVIGREFVEPAESWTIATAGVVLQGAVLAVPLLTIERVAKAAEGPRRPLRLAYVAMVAYLAMLPAFGALSTIVATDDPALWTELAAYLIMAALVQIMGAIAINSGFSSIEEAAAHRYTLRRQFGENAMLQPAR